MDLPLELRNEIYSYLMIHLSASLLVPKTLSGSAVRFLTRRLPHCLLLNHQVLEEAAMVYLRRTILVVDTTTFFAIENMLSQFSGDIAYRNVYFLEFTQPQPYYARSYESQPSLAPTNCVQDIVSRCPSLRHLTFTIPLDMLALTRKESKVPRARTFEEIEAKMKFSRLFEHENLREIHFFWVPGKYRDGVTDDWSELFESFGTALGAEAQKGGSRLKVEVHIPYPTKIPTKFSRNYRIPSRQRSSLNYNWR